MNTLSYTQVAQLVKAVGTRRVVLVEGEAGIGKTSIFYALANDPAFAHYHKPKPIDCTQLSDGSLWMPDIDRTRGIARELPNERFGVDEENNGNVPGSRPVLICFDEIAKARQYVKDAIAPIINERRLGNYLLPEGSIVFCCTNLSDEGLGDSMQMHLRNRLTIVQMRKPTKDEWINNFALANNVCAEVIAAVEMYPTVFDSFLDYDKNGKFAGRNIDKDNPYISNPRNAAQGQVVTPRSLHIASDIIDARSSMDDITLQAALEGAVGAPFAANIMTMLRFGAQVPSFEIVVAEPDKAPLPANPSAQIVQVFQFIKQTTDVAVAQAVCTYVRRMRSEMQALFVNRVADSSQLSKFALSGQFADMLRANRELMVGA